MQTDSRKQVGTRRIERLGRLLEVTGPERTLAEGFSRTALVGGLEELVRSAGSFTTLDLDLLEEVLRLYDLAKLWAAVGLFMECFQKGFHVPEPFLACAWKSVARAREYTWSGTGAEVS